MSLSMCHYIYIYLVYVYNTIFLSQFLGPLFRRGELFSFLARRFFCFCRYLSKGFHTSLCNLTSAASCKQGLGIITKELSQYYIAIFYIKGCYTVIFNIKGYITLYRLYI